MPIAAFKQATHTHTQAKPWLVDMKVDDPLHNTPSVLFSVANSTEIEREEGAQLQVIFNPYVGQGYVPPSTIP